MKNHKNKTATNASLKTGTTLLMLLLTAKVNSLDVSRDLTFTSLTEFIIQGEYNVSYDLFAGGEAQYTFMHHNRWHPFIKGGYRRSLSQEGASLSLLNTDIGTRYDLFSLWGIDTFAEASLGATYAMETFSTQLIDREANTTFNEWSYKASLGFGMAFNDRWSTQIFVNQFGSRGTSAGLSLSVSF